MNGVDLTQFINFGVAGVAVIIIWFIVQKFLDFVSKQEENFKNTIDNHLDHQAEISEKLKDAIYELIIFLKHRDKDNC